MARLSAAIVVAVFMSLILGVGGESKVVEKRDLSIQIQTIPASDIYNWLCAGNPLAPYMAICSTTTTPIPSTTTPISGTTGSSQQPTTTESTSSSSSASPLQNAHWCSFSNGSYIPLGYSFMYSQCTLCQCTQSHAILCTILQCIPTYCIDGSTPTQRAGQCCSQCAYEPNATTCSINGISFPDGAIIKKQSNGVQCWCQLGNVECRQFSSTVFSGLDIWGPGTAIYVVVIILCVLLIFGTLLCCGCTLFYYYYYKRNQQSIQQAYDQYYNSAGWQPMGEEGQVVDSTAEEKQAEAEQNQFEQEHPTGNSQEYISPPYALYNGTYVNENDPKEQKHI